MRNINVVNYPFIKTQLNYTGNLACTLIDLPLRFTKDGAENLSITSLISHWIPVTDLPHWPALDSAGQFSGGRWRPYGEGSPARSRPPAAPSPLGWERRAARPMSPGWQRGKWVAVMGPGGRMNPGPGKNNNSASWSQYPWEMGAGNTILRKSRMINTLLLVQGLIWYVLKTFASMLSVDTFI